MFPYVFVCLFVSRITQKPKEQGFISPTSGSSEFKCGFIRGVMGLSGGMYSTEKSRVHTSSFLCGSNMLHQPLEV